MIDAVRFLLFIGFAATLTGAHAQGGYPNRPIRLIIPFAAGGAVDIMARPIAKKLTEQLGQSVVVDNRGGAGGSIAAELTAKSPPDGYTLFLGSTSPLVINPAFIAKLGYDSVKDFTPISLVVQQPLIIVAHPSLPVRNVKDVVALARKNPGKLNYGTAGHGTTNHLVGALLSHTAGIKMEHVPFKGGAPALVALLGGEIELQISQPNTMLPYVKSGKVRAIATTGAKRSHAYPDVGTLVEAGYKDLDIKGWYCIVAPAGLPRPLVDRLNTETRRAITSSEVNEILVAEGTEPITSTPEELAALIKSELVRWSRAVQLAGIKPQ